MAFTPDDIRANREFFAGKLRAEAEKQAVVNWVKKEPGAKEIVLLDTRSRDAFAKAHVEGALSVPLDELKQVAEKLPRDKTLVVYCWNQYWHIGAKAALQLAELGFFCKELNVGWAEWVEAKLPTHEGRVERGSVKCTCSRL